MIWFFSIIANYFGGICLCLLITAGVVAGIFYLIRAMYPKYSYTPINLLTGAVLFVLLFIQSVLMYGAMSIKNELDFYTDMVQTQINRVNRGRQRVLDKMEIQEMNEKFANEYPLIAQFVDEIDIESYDIEHIAEAYTDEIRSTLNIYILKRGLWSLLFIIVGIFVIGKSAANGGGKNSQTKKTTSYRSRMSTYRH